jgi:hypothetical protein
MASIDLNMFGITCSVSSGTTIRILPDSNQSPEITVNVGGISFIVSEDMLRQRNDPDLKVNAFAVILGRDGDVFPQTIDFPKDEITPPQIYTAKMYPVLFDFLRRRLINHTARMRMTRFEATDIQDLDVLEDYLFPDYAQKRVPTVDQGNVACFVLTNGEYFSQNMELEGKKQSVELCLDPEFIRLVMAAQQKRFMRRTYTDEQIVPDEILERLAARHKTEKLTPHDVFSASIEYVNREDSVTLHRYVYDSLFPRIMCQRRRARDWLYL